MDDIYEELSEDIGRENFGLREDIKKLKLKMRIKNKLIKQLQQKNEQLKKRIIELEEIIGYLQD